MASISWGSSKSSSSSSRSSSSSSSSSDSSSSSVPSITTSSSTSSSSTSYSVSSTSSTSENASSLSASSLSGSASSNSCPDICIRADGQNHYLTGTFLTNAEEDTEKCGYILSVGGLDYSIFVMVGGGVEVGANNNDPSTFYPDLDTFISDNPYGFSECTSSSSGSSGSGSSISSSSGYLSSSAISSSGTSSSEISSASQSLGSTISTSSIGDSGSSTHCGEFCVKIDGEEVTAVGTLIPSDTGEGLCCAWVFSQAGTDYLLSSKQTDTGECEFTLSGGQGKLVV